MGLSPSVLKIVKKRLEFYNIKKIQTLKKLLHTNGKPHHSIVMARKIIEGTITEKKINLSTAKTQNKSDIDQLIYVSENLKKLLK